MSVACLKYMYINENSLSMAETGARIQQNLNTQFLLANFVRDCLLNPRKSVRCDSQFPNCLSLA